MDFEPGKYYLIQISTIGKRSSRPGTSKVEKMEYVELFRDDVARFHNFRNEKGKVLTIPESFITKAEVI